MLHGTSTTWFQTSHYCRAIKVEINSIDRVRHGNSTTFETGLKDSFHMTVWLSENMYLFLSKNIRNYIYVFLNKNKDKKNLVDWKTVPVFLMHYLSRANYCSSQRVPRASAGLSSFQGLPRISKFTSLVTSAVCSM